MLRRVTASERTCCSLFPPLVPYVHCEPDSAACSVIVSDSVLPSCFSLFPFIILTNYVLINRYMEVEPVHQLIFVHKYHGSNFFCCISKGFGPTSKIKQQTYHFLFECLMN